MCGDKNRDNSQPARQADPTQNLRQEIKIRSQEPLANELKKRLCSRYKSIVLNKCKSTFPNGLTVSCL